MAALGINAGYLLVQLVNFLIIFAVLRIAWPRLVKLLDDRKERIAKSLEDARVAEQARANAERDAQKLMDERRAEAAKMIEDARSQADAQARELLEQARQDAEGIRVKARQDAEEERNQLLSEVRSQVVQLALAASERLIGQTLDQKKSTKIVNEFFSKSTADLQQLGGDSVEVTTALPLTDAEKNNLTSSIGAKTVNFKVDPGILGGVIARAGDRVIDGSVRAELNQLSSRLR
ncbi:MAG: F0F1 ATP synthase subunit B [Aggregatilineales bacterium]